MIHLSLCPMYLKVHVNLAEVSLTLFPMYLKFQINLAEVSFIVISSNQFCACCHKFETIFRILSRV